MTAGDWAALGLLAWCARSDMRSNYSFRHGWEMMNVWGYLKPTKGKNYHGIRR